MKGHKVKITFELGYRPRVSVEHPGMDGGCKPPTFCSECERNLASDDPPCEVCEDVSDQECWLQSWGDAGELNECVEGSVTLPIDVEWDGDNPILHVG